MVEESKECDAPAPPIFAPQMRNFRAAVMRSKKPDRVMELLRAHLLSKFVIPTSDQGRAELGTLTAQEREIKNGLMHGAFIMSQWSPAYLALFSAAELRTIGDT
jgi:hypothetical protein